MAVKTASIRFYCLWIVLLIMYAREYDTRMMVYVHAYTIITILNTILPWFLCFFLSSTTTIFRFLELPIVGMFTRSSINFIEGTHYFKSFIQHSVCLHSKESGPAKLESYGWHIKSLFVTCNLYNHIYCLLIYQMVIHINVLIIVDNCRQILLVICKISTYKLFKFYQNYNWIFSIFNYIFIS